MSLGREDGIRSGSVSDGNGGDGYEGGAWNVTRHWAGSIGAWVDGAEESREMEEHIEKSFERKKWLV